MVAKFTTKARESMFSNLVQHHITDNTTTLNALDFVESPQGLNIKLYPVQRVLLKLIFGIPMDMDEHEVPVYDIFCEHLLYTFKETEYIKYVHEQGRINLTDWQSAPPEGYNEVVAVVGRRGGKAVSLDTPVPTPAGFIPMGDLKVGDFVYSPTGATTKIIQAHQPFTDQTYRVGFDDGTSVVCHGGHLWHTLSKNERKNNARRWPNTGPRPQMCKGISAGSVKTTLEIMNTLTYKRADGKKENNHSIPLTRPVLMAEASLPIDPYFLGQWLADGDSNMLAITTMDPETAAFIHNTGATNGLDVVVSNNGSAANRYALVSKVKASNGRGMVGRNPLSDIFRSLGLFDQKHIPQNYLWASVDQRLSLLQGLMDADGGCYRNRCEFNNTNEALSRGVYQLAASLGLKPYWSVKRATLYGKDCGACYRVTWTGALGVFRLPRKLKELPAKPKSCQNHRIITSVEPEGVQEVRCITVENPDGLFLFGHNFNVTHNSQLVSAIAAYKLYKLLNIRSPQEYYGLVPSSPIDFTFMAQDSEGASRLYDKMKEDVNRAPFFAPFLKSMNTEEMAFVSEADRGKRDVTPSIKVASFPCTTGSVRGPSSFLLALDEFGFYRAQIGSSSDEIYKAAAPATMQFKAGGTRDGKRESMILIITSPNGKIGKYYSLYQSGMKMGNKSDILAFRCSTAEMNPRSDVDFLKKEFRESPDVFQAEYGGNFLEAAESYVKLSTIGECVDLTRGNVTSFETRMVGQKNFWGLDLGMQHDGTGLAICHWEPLGNGLGAKLVYDVIDRLMVGEHPYENVKQLPLDDVLEWLRLKNDLLPCHKGATDQHGGSMLVQLLQNYGINGLDLVHLTSGINSQMYLVFKGLLEQKKISLPNEERFLSELKLVEASYSGKYQIRVQAPAEKDAHDDMCDASALASWVAQQWALGEGSREFADICDGWSPANFTAGLPNSGLDVQTASMAELKSYERQLALMQKINSGVQNPYRRR